MLWRVGVAAVSVLKCCREMKNGYRYPFELRYLRQHFR